jgi:bifunctional ADP-heptose synthase (sugar kinase/adenylyltransferase)
MGDVERLSPEAPVPVLRVVSEEPSGGAANVIII